MADKAPGNTVPAVTAQVPPGEADRMMSILGALDGSQCQTCKHAVVIWAVNARPNYSDNWANHCKNCVCKMSMKWEPKASPNLDEQKVSSLTPEDEITDALTSIWPGITHTKLDI